MTKRPTRTHPKLKAERRKPKTPQTKPYESGLHNLDYQWLPHMGTTYDIVRLFMTFGKLCPALAQKLDKKWAETKNKMAGLFQLRVWIVRDRRKRCQSKEPIRIHGHSTINRTVYSTVPKCITFCTGHKHLYTISTHCDFYVICNK